MANGWDLLGPMAAPGASNGAREIHADLTEMFSVFWLKDLFRAGNLPNPRPRGALIDALGRPNHGRGHRPCL